MKKFVYGLIEVFIFWISRVVVRLEKELSVMKDVLFKLVGKGKRGFFFVLVG